MIVSENLCFEYAQFDSSEPSVKTLDDVSLSIEAGEFVAVLGHNGSGKSTFAKHLNGLLTPTGGSLWIKGRDASDQKNLWKIRQSVGMVFQNPDNQIVATTVEEDVAFGPENLGIAPDEIRKRVDEALADVRLSDYSKRQPHHLSGGQKQRVAIAGVLAMRPSCIVLDEPTAMLDPRGRKEVIKTIARLNREYGITVILITHFMEEAAKANRIIVMENGRPVLDGTPQEVFRQMDVMNRLGLGVPQVTALAHKLREGGVDVSDSVLSVEEFLQDEAIREILKI